MLHFSGKYLLPQLQRTVLFFCLQLLAFSTISAQQNRLSSCDAKALNPLMYAAFKKPIRANPVFEAYIKPGRFELMYWPNYPLTPEQIAARDRRYEQSLGQQIASDIIGTAVNTILYGKKLPPAKVPKF